jgi:type I restriction enzyme S subunit
MLECKLSDIADVVDCEHKTAPTVSNSDYYSIRTTDILGGKIDFEKANRVSYETYLDWTKRALPESGDLILAREAPVGEIGWIKEGYKTCLGQRTVLIKVKSNEIDSRFLLYYFVNPSTKSQLQEQSGGSVVSHLNMKDIRNFDLQIPSIEQQKAIASLLSSLDDKIDLLHRQNTTLERMAETLFRQWFVEEAQEDWEERPLKDVCQINNGYAFQSETYRESGQKIIRTMNFNNHWIELNSLVYISDELAKSFKKYYLKRNDFLLVMVGASLGNFAIVTDDVLPSLQNQNMWCFRANESNFQHYLNFALRNIINDALNGASGSAREFFQKGVFYEIKVSTPPEDLILKFHDISESYFSKIELNRKQIKTLEKLRDNLLPKLMNGEVRIHI